VHALGTRGDPVQIAEARKVADDLRTGQEAAAGRLAARGTILLPEAAAWFVTAEAEHARAAGADEPAQWAAATAAWERAGQPAQRARAQLRQAEAIACRRGSRDDAAALLRDALATAVTVGAAPLEKEIRLLARQARLEIAAGATQRDNGGVLDVTPRELDVLRLVAQGRTNRQIGETLFISEKTASVHVTNLLRKLGVGSRVEAAAVAVRTGVADGP
jgi:DNA-binding CsgD family transcriptional regulator